MTKVVVSLYEGRLQVKPDKALRNNLQFEIHIGLRISNCEFHMMEVVVHLCGRRLQVKPDKALRNNVQFEIHIEFRIADFELRISHDGGCSASVREKASGQTPQGVEKQFAIRNPQFEIRNSYRSQPMSERKIIVYIATSADGYIARVDGSVDWLNRPRTSGDYGMSAFFKSIDTILWGRKTYDMSLGFGKKSSSGGYGAKIKSYVFTSNPPASPNAQVEFVNEPIKKFATHLRELPGKDIWMMGGAGIIASFLDAGELDEFIIHVIPTFIGEGIPLIEPRHRDVSLKLLSTHAYPDGVLRIHYRVERKSESKAKSGRKRPSKHVTEVNGS